MHSHRAIRHSGNHLAHQYLHRAVPANCLHQYLMIHLRLPERIPAIHQNRLARDPAENQRIGHGGITSAEHNDRLSPTDHTVAYRAVINRHPKMPVNHRFSVFCCKSTLCLANVTLVKWIAALRAELRRILRIRRLKTALIALIQRRTRRLLRAAFRTELAFIHCAASAGPALSIRLLRAAFRTEFSRCHGAAGTLPSSGRLSGLLRLLLRAHLEELSGIHTIALCHIHAHEASESACRILRCILHGLRLGANHMCGRHIGIAEDRIALKRLDHRLVFLGSLDRIDADGDHLNAAQLRPLFREHIIERLSKLHGMTRKRAVTNAHLRDSGKGRLQRRKQFALELAVNPVAV